MEKSIKLSICIVAYNNYNDIKKAIKSIDIFTSSNIKYKIYIVDNGSMITKKSDINNFINYIGDYKNVEYIDAMENIGFGAGHNLVLNKIDSDYHAIVNPDIVFCEDAFFKILEWLEKNEDIGMVIPQIIDKNGNLQKVYREEITVFDLFNRMFLKNLLKKRSYNHTMQYMDFNRPFQVPFGQGSFLVIRTELFKKLGGFDDNFFMYVEDADLSKRVNLISRFMYYPDAKVIHKWEKGSHKDLKLFLYHMRSIVYYFNKWGWKFY